MLYIILKLNPVEYMVLIHVATQENVKKKKKKEMINYFHLCHIKIFYISIYSFISNQNLFKTNPYYQY